MFRKQISPKVAAVAVLLILGSIQFVYWRLLVYRPAAPPAPAGGAAGGGSMAPSAMGRADVRVQTIAGGGAGYRDGALWEARFCGPNALALSKDGVLYVADSRNHRVRALSGDGKVTTVAGGGEPDGAGGRAEGAALSARFSYPSGVALGPDGSLYVADTGNHRICRIRDEQVSTLAGGTEGNADGVGAAAKFRYPSALFVDEAGSLWVADAGNHRVRKVEATGQVSTPAAVPDEIGFRLGQVSPPSEHPGVAASSEGQWEEEATPFTVGRRSPSGAVLAQARLFADTEHRVLMLSRKGAADLLLVGRRTQQDLPGESTDGDGRRAGFVMPCALTMTPDGNAYVADYAANVIRKVFLPEWVRKGEAAPAGRRRRQWRVGSGG
jgi:sugar lactone lactonase YvrE